MVRFSLIQLKEGSIGKDFHSTEAALLQLPNTEVGMSDCYFHQPRKFGEGFKRDGASLFSRSDACAHTGEAMIAQRRHPKSSSFSTPLRPTGPRFHCAPKAEDFAPARRRHTAKIEPLREAPTIQTSRKSNRPTGHKSRRAQRRPCFVRQAANRPSCPAARQPQQSGEAVLQPQVCFESAHCRAGQRE